MTNQRLVALCLIIGILIVILPGKTTLLEFQFTSENTKISPAFNRISKTADFVNSQKPIKTPLPSEIKVSNPQPNTEINQDQIWSHLENLVGERYTENHREYTRHYLIKQLQKFGFSLDLQPFEEGINIVAKRATDDPNAATLLIGAHYDTVVNSPGADDNASGIAVILEIARLFGSTPTATSLEIVFFDQEELGLFGSFAFTSRPENLQTLRHVIILDMVGYACRVEGCQHYPTGLNVQPLLEVNGITPGNKGEFLVVVGEIQHRDLLESFQQLPSNLSNQTLPPILPLPIPLKGILTPDVLRSDHAPFWDQNIAAVLVTDTANLRSPHYHQPTDTLANLDPEFLMGSAQVLVNVVTQLLEN